MDRHVVVVGAGISGLAAALDLRDRPGVRVTVLEASARVGGKLRTSELAGLPVDEGAEALLARVPEGLDLVRRVGLDHELVPAATTAAGVHIAGRTLPLPAGTLLGIPADVDAVERSGILDRADVERLRAEAASPGVPLTQDVAVGALVRERLGDAVVDRLVDPLLGGVYAGHADRLSLRATVPALAAALALEGSLVRAARVAVAAPGDQPVFVTLRTGLGELAQAVARACGADVRTGVTVRAVEPAGDGFRVVTGPAPMPVTYDADAVVLAVPGSPAARLLATVAPDAAAALATVEYASTGLVTLAFPAGTSLPPGSGLLVPAVEGYTVKALTYTTQKWPHLAGAVVVRASVGRAGEPQPLQRSDADLTELCVREVAALTGVTTAPVATRVSRWGGALPQYAPGHLDLVSRVRAALPPGLAVCGAAYDGVGIPACIRSGREAGETIGAWLSTASAPRS